MSTLLESGKISESAVAISVLIRGQERIKSYETKGVQPIIFNSLDETALLQKVASEHDSLFPEASRCGIIELTTL